MGRDPGGEGRYWTLATLALVVLLLTWLWVVTASCVASAWSFPCFLLAVAAFAYLPGRALLAIVSVEVGALESLALSLILGVNLSGGIYYLLGVAGMTRFLLLWPLLAGAVLAWRRWRTGGRSFEFSADLSHVLLVALMGLAVLPLTELPLYFRNACALPDGTLSFYPLPDGVLHLSLANELTHSFPPQVPFLPGTPLRYHYGMDLLAAMFGTAGLSIPDLTVRFLPFFFQVCTTLALFCFARTWLGSPRWALLATLLVLFGEDLSFVPGLINGSPQPWVVSFFFMPNVVALYLLNPMLPALGLLFGALLCLSAFERTADRRWLGLMSLLVAILVEYKLFAAMQLILSLGLAAVVFLLRFRDRKLLEATAVSVVLAAPVALWLGAGPGPGVTLEFRPWPYVPAALAALGLAESLLGQRIAALFLGGSPGFLGVVGFLVALPVYLLGTWGARVLGLPRALRDSVRPRTDAGLGSCLAFFALVGTPISLLCAVTPSGYPPFTQYNNASWFLVQSKYVAWLLVVQALMAWSRERTRLVRWALATVLLGLALPSSIQYFAFQVSRARLQQVGSAERGVLAFLNENGRAGQIVYAPTQVAERIVSMTRCRATALTVYPSSFISMADLAERDRVQGLFWSAWREGRVRADMLAVSGAAFVVVPRTVRPAPGASPGALSESGLVRAFENDGFVVYRVSGAGEPRAAP